MEDAAAPAAAAEEAGKFLFVTYSRLAFQASSEGAHISESRPWLVFIIYSKSAASNGQYSNASFLVNFQMT